jgi:hypothetical protein
MGSLVRILYSKQEHKPCQTLQKSDQTKSENRTTALTQVRLRGCVNVCALTQPGGIDNLSRQKVKSSELRFWREKSRNPADETR